MTGIHPMTPLYASPEHLSAAPITVATDVYGLGLLLYELLTGERPFALAGLPPAAAERVVREQPPLPPSEALRAGAPRAGLPFGPSELAGDLDNIVLLALAKEPDRRYPSVRHLAEDVARYLDHRPVSARGDRWSYRLRRFLRRRAIPLAIGSAFVLLVGAFVVLVARQSSRAARERDLAEAERDRAENVSAFMTEVFSAADLARARGRPVTARALLEQASSVPLAAFRNQPETRARLTLTMARAHAGLGMFAEAIALLEPERLRLQRELGARHPAIAEISMALSLMWQWRAELPKAEAFAREAWAIRDASSDGDALDTAACLARIAELHAVQGRLAQALEQRRRRLGPDHPDVAHALTVLAAALRAAGRVEAAEQRYREAVDLAEATLPAGDLKIAYPHLLLGDLLLSAGRAAEAEPHLRRAVALRERKLAPDHPLLVKAKEALADCLLARRAHATAVRGEEPPAAGWAPGARPAAPARSWWAV